MVAHPLDINKTTKLNNVSDGSIDNPRGSQKLNRNIQSLKTANFSAALFGQG